MDLMDNRRNKLNDKQKRFCIEYSKSGDITSAVAYAGYSKKRGAKTGREILKRPEAAEFISSQSNTGQFGKVADMEEIKAFWSSIMRDSEVKATERLKASELCAKVQGAFIDRVDEGEIQTLWFKE